MNSKSLLFIFALLALFTLASTNAIEEIKKRYLEDDELLSDALSLMQKLLKSKEEKEKQRIAESLNVEDVKDEIEIEEEPELNVSNEKFAVNNELGQDEDVEIVTVTVEVDEEDLQVNTVDNGKAMQGIDVTGDETIEVDVVEGEEVNDADAGVIEDPEFNVDANELNVVDAEVEDPEAIGTVEYEDVPEEAPKEKVTYLYTVEEGDYDENDDAINGVITEVDKIEKNGKAGVVGASLAIVGAFGVVAGFGYKYTKRSKRVLLPFHEDSEFFDKENAEQHIIPVWAATCKKEENEEEKEDEEKLFEVVYNYEPELPDELKLTVGDKIKIKEIYEDGWAYGYNKTTQLFGTFPSTSLGENFNPESVPQYKPEEVAVEMNDNMVEELKKKIVGSN